MEFKDLREISESNEMIYESSIINETETLESKFKLVYSDKIINEVCDLSLNSKMYFSDNHKLIYPKSYEATDFMFQLDEFISSNHLYTNYFLFCGNKGIGKTTNLLWNLRNNPQCKSLYLDIKILTSYKYTKEEMTEKIKMETRRYAKRQLTWFKKIPNIIWLDGLNDIQNNVNIILEGIK